MKQWNSQLEYKFIGSHPKRRRLLQEPWSSLPPRGKRDKTHDPPALPFLHHASGMPRIAHRVVLIEPASIAGIERRGERSSFEACCWPVFYCPSIQRGRVDRREAAGDRRLRRFAESNREQAAASLMPIFIFVSI